MISLTKGMLAAMAHTIGNMFLHIEGWDGMDGGQQEPLRRRLNGTHVGSEA